MGCSFNSCHIQHWTDIVGCCFWKGRGQKCFQFQQQFQSVWQNSVSGSSHRREMLFYFKDFTSAEHDRAVIVDCTRKLQGGFCILLSAF